MLYLIRKLAACLCLSLVMILSGTNVFAQDKWDSAVVIKTFSKSHVFIGTQIPLQFTAGYGYQFSNRFSARAQAGLITKPYDNFIVNAMEAFGLDKYLSTVIKKAFQNGTVLGIGPDYHFGQNYVGVYGQYIHLKGGGITPADALSVYFKKDFSGFDLLGLPVFEFSMQSNMLNTGALFGHTFQLKNPQFALNLEAGISKIVASKNSFASNRPLVDATPFAQNLYKELDDEIQSAYWKHGFIPTLNFYLVYRLP